MSVIDARPAQTPVVGCNTHKLIFILTRNEFLCSPFWKKFLYFSFIQSQFSLMCKSIKIHEIGINVTHLTYRSIFSPNRFLFLTTVFSSPFGVEMEKKIKNILELCNQLFFFVCWKKRCAVCVDKNILNNKAWADRVGSICLWLKVEFFL